MPPIGTAPSRPRLQAVVVAFAITIAATQIGAIVQGLVESDDFIGFAYLDSSSRQTRDLALLGFAGVLVAAAPRRSGLTFGTSTNRKHAVLACLLVFGVAAAYRYSSFDFPTLGTLNEMRLRILRGCPATTSWLVSPLAQEAIFSGFILGYLHQYFPRRLYRALPVTGAVVITAALFGLWHFIPDYLYGGNSAGFAAFRFAYTAAGMVVYGTVRIWTGSIVYAVLTHTAVNYIFLAGFGCVVSGLA